MPYTPSPGASSLLSPRQSHRLARLWRVTRTDGFALYLTDHDHQLPAFDGQTYTPIGGLDASALRKASALEEQNAEVRGVLNSDAVTYDDLRAGRWKEAEIHEYVVDWLVPWVGPMQHSRFWITETKQDGERWTAHISGIPFWLRFNTGQVASRTCATDLGSNRCKVALEPLEFLGDVLSVNDEHIEFEDSAIPDSEDGYWADGLITWVSGANTGLTSKIRTYDDTTKVIRLFLRTPFPIEAGDTYSMIPGCDGLATTCKDKFDNLVNHQGDKFFPGTDKLIAPPTS